MTLTNVSVSRRASREVAGLPEGSCRDAVTITPLRTRTDTDQHREQQLEGPASDTVATVLRHGDRIDDRHCRVRAFGVLPRLCALRVTAEASPLVYVDAVTPQAAIAVAARAVCSNNDFALHPNCHGGVQPSQGPHRGRSASRRSRPFGLSTPVA